MSSEVSPRSSLKLSLYWFAENDWDAYISSKVGIARINKNSLSQNLLSDAVA